MAQKKKTDLVERFKTWMRSHPLFGPLIILGLIFATVVGFLTDAYKIYDLAVPDPMPELEVLFIDKQGPTAELNIRPSWSDFDSAGLSEPIPIVIGVRNRGGVAATNVRIHLVYPPAIFAFEEGSGEPVVPAVLGDVLNITGDETAQSFSIERVDTSNIFDDFEKSLRLRLRLRVRVGIPIYKNGTLAILPLSMDFTNTNTNELGVFPVEYTVSYSESKVDKKGVIYLKIDQSRLEILISSHKRPDTVMRLMGEGDDPKLDHPIQSTKRSIPFVKGDRLLATNIILNLIEPTPESFIDTIVTENGSDSDQWQLIIAEGECPVVLMDRGKDGSLDAMYVNTGNVKESHWIHLEPDQALPYVGLSNIVDPKKDAPLTGILRSSLGLSD